MPSPLFTECHAVTAWWVPNVSKHCGAWNVLEEGPSSWEFWFLVMRPPHCLETSVTHQRRTEVVFVSFFFYPYRSCVELNSTARFVVQGPMSSSYRHFILQCFMLVSLTSCCPVVPFELWRLEILGKINLGQTVGIHKNNWECIRLNILRHFQKASTNSVMISFLWHVFYFTYVPPCLRLSYWRSVLFTSSLERIEGILGADCDLWPRSFSLRLSSCDIRRLNSITLSSADLWNDLP